jgi:ascorbate-specific PTS system EIIC-type component UlaA
VPDNRASPHQEVIVGIGRILGFMLVVAGTVFLVSAWRATDSVKERAVEAFTGRYTERTQRDLALGAGGVVGGVLLIALGGRRRR